VLPRLLARFPRLTYVVVGEGADHQRLRCIAEEYGVSSAVRILGHVDGLRPCYSASDAFVMPSTQEGFGIVYLEAMACGVPVVAGGIDGSSSALSWGECGYLCDPYSSESVEAAIVSALLGPSRGDARGDSSWLAEQVILRFGNDSFDKRVSGLFEDAPCSAASLSRSQRNARVNRRRRVGLS
jgi:glycosyltransferase involved in cell wall biosynthesis